MSHGHVMAVTAWRLQDCVEPESQPHQEALRPYQAPFPGESNGAEDLSAPTARLGHIHAVRAQEFAAVGFSEPHETPFASGRLRSPDKNPDTAGKVIAQREG